MADVSPDVEDKVEVASSEQAKLMYLKEDDEDRKKQQQQQKNKNKKRKSEKKEEKKNVSQEHFQQQKKRPKKTQKKKKIKKLEKKKKENLLSINTRCKCKLVDTKTTSRCWIGHMITNSTHMLSRHCKDHNICADIIIMTDT